MRTLKLFGLLIVILAIVYFSAGLLLRNPIFRAHTPFTFYQIIRIHGDTPLFEASTPDWNRLSSEDRKVLLASLESHVVDWNSTDYTESELLDSWGTPCIIEARNMNGVTDFRFTSSGPDKTFRTDDDIITTKLEKVEQSHPANPRDAGG